MRDVSSGAVISGLCYLSHAREDVEGNPTETAIMARQHGGHIGSAVRRWRRETEV